MPRPGAAGHLAYNHAIIGFLAGRGHHVTVLVTGTRLPWPMLRTGRFLDPARVTVAGSGIASRAGTVWLTAPRAIAACLARQLLLALPVGVAAALRRRGRARTYGDADAVLGRAIDAASADWCAARIASLRPDAVLVDTLFRAPLLTDRRLAGIPSLLVAHDVFHQRHAALAACGFRVHPPALTAVEEARLLSHADVIAAIQPNDRAALAALLPGRSVFTAGMPVIPVPRPPAVARVPFRLVFVGSASPHNVDGMRWFLDAVWPALREAMPAVTLDLCGEAGGALGRVPPGVRRLGRVKRLAPVLHRASLAVAPLRAGSGLKVKLLDYFAHGLAAVTTPVGAAGLPASPVLAVETGAAGMAVRITALCAADAIQREADALALAGRYAPDDVFTALAGVLRA